MRLRKRESEWRTFAQEELESQKRAKCQVITMVATNLIGVNSRRVLSRFVHDGCKIDSYSHSKIGGFRATLSKSQAAVFPMIRINSSSNPYASVRR